MGLGRKQRKWLVDVVGEEGNGAILDVAFCVLCDLVLISDVDEDGIVVLLVGGPNNIIDPLGEVLVRGSDDDDEAMVVVGTVQALSMLSHSLYWH